MYAQVTSCGSFALEGFRVTVEADISGGLPAFEIVGLPDSAVKEAKDRVRSALKNNGFSWPVSRITVNLAPADIKKTGPVYDLPVLLAVLLASEQLPSGLPVESGFLGELALDGTVRSVTGVLPMAIAAAEHGVRVLFVPQDNAPEAAVVDGLTVIGVPSLSALLGHLSGTCLLPVQPRILFDAVELPAMPDFAEVHGQEEARRALEIAAAGFHNCLLVGPPGTGKSMLAKRLPSILPPMTESEAIETAKVYSVAGLLEKGTALSAIRPFRSPHHSVSPMGLSGGGSNPRPGEVSLSHNGVLFLDELPEFSRDALEILRQPMEDGTVTISRVAATATYPCRMMVIAAMNPCPCGFYGHPTKPCSCTPSAIDRYLQKISGPLLDRVDLHVEVPPVEYSALSSSSGGESSAEIRARVIAARELQLARYRGTGITCNAHLTPKLLRRFCKLTPAADQLMGNAFARLGLSARAYDRILKVSRTIADLAGCETIEAVHLSEAIQYRTLDRKYHFVR